MPLWLLTLAVCFVLPHQQPAAAQAKKTVEEAIIDLLELRPGMVVAEIGAGNGDLAANLAGPVSTRTESSVSRPGNRLPVILVALLQ